MLSRLFFAQILFVVTLLFTQGSKYCEASFQQNDDKNHSKSSSDKTGDAGKKRAYPRSVGKEALQGFGREEKQFLKPKNLPESVKTAVRKSVRKLCGCEIKLESCITVTSIGKKGQFITTEHALESWIKQVHRMVKNSEKEGKQCPYNFISIKEDGQIIEVSWSALKRGSPPTSQGPAGIRFWIPRNHYKHGTESFPDHSQDLALLEIPELQEDTVPLKFASGYIKGTEVYHGGFPVLRAVLPKDISKYLVQPMALVSTGNVQSISGKNVEADFLGVVGTSGGPVLNKEGHVVGIFWGKATTWREALMLDKEVFFEKNGYPRERAFFIPYQYVQAFIK